KLADEPTGARLRVTAAVDAVEHAVAVELAAAPAGKDTWKSLRTVPANTDFTLTRREAGGPGSYRIRATFAGDDARQHAVAEGTLGLTAGTQLTLAARATA